jgi:hypothetical protein
MLLEFTHNKNIYFAMEIFLGISVLTSLILSIIGFVELHFSHNALKDITTSWEKHPIFEIFTNSQGCKDSSSPLLTDEWVGTVEGCDCRNIWDDDIPWDYQNRLNRVRCDYNMTYAGCRNIPQNDPVPLNIWRSTFICAKTRRESYLDLHRTSARSNKYCPNGLKQCGKLDTLGNLLCIPLEDTCPINKIIIQPESKEPPSDFKYKDLNLSDRTKLYYTNEAIEEKILVDIKISEGDVCVDASQHNTKFPGKSYILDRDYNNLGCNIKIKNSEYDNRYVMIDTYPKQQVYFDNGLKYLISRLPEYPLSNLDADLSIYLRPYIGWKIYSSSSSDEDLGIVKTLSQTVSHISTLKMINMIFFIIIFVFFIFQVFLKWENKGCLNLLEFIFVCFAIANFILSYLSLSKNEFSIDFKEFSEGDEITNAIFEEIGLKLVSTRGKDKTLFIFSLFNILLYPLYLVVQLYNRRKSSSYYTGTDNYSMKE